jgi:hypothetical protein
METAVEVVETWFAENREALTASGGGVSIRSLESRDAKKGKVLISLERKKVLATITLWNSQRQIEVIALDQLTNEPHVLIDRALSPDEEIAPLLSRIFYQVAAEPPSFTAVESP